MSFDNYGAFQNQQGQQEAGGAGPGAPQQQDASMGGQMSDNPAAQFQGGNGADPGSAGGQQPGGDAKTTLWYVTNYNINDLSCVQAIMSGSDGVVECVGSPVLDR